MVYGIVIIAIIVGIVWATRKKVEVPPEEVLPEIPVEPPYVPPDEPPSPTIPPITEPVAPAVRTLVEITSAAIADNRIIIVYRVFYVACPDVVVSAIEDGLTLGYTRGSGALGFHTVTLAVHQAWSCSWIHAEYFDGAVRTYARYYF